MNKLNSHALPHRNTRASPRVAADDPQTAPAATHPFKPAGSLFAQIAAKAKPQ